MATRTRSAAPKPAGNGVRLRVWGGDVGPIVLRTWAGRSGVRTALAGSALGREHHLEPSKSQRWVCWEAYAKEPNRLLSS